MGYTHAVTLNREPKTHRTIDDMGITPCTDKRISQVFMYTQLIGIPLCRKHECKKCHPLVDENHSTSVKQINACQNPPDQNQACEHLK